MHWPDPESRWHDECRGHAELRAARQPMLPGESARYARLCADAAGAMTDVLSAAQGRRPLSSSSRRPCARIVAAGAEPLVLLCNGSSRSAFRHPLATHSPVGRSAMAVVCARRHGLVANVTRWVRFDAGTPDELDAENSIAAVEADIFDCHCSGRPARRRSSPRSRPRTPGTASAPTSGTLHHQGGPAGYAGRDPRVTAVTDDVVVPNQPFTWNPSGPGVKIEDTVQLTAAGTSVLTLDPRWPASDVNGLPRPLTLQL